MTQYLVADFDELVSVDGSIELLDLIPDYPNHKKVYSMFEDFVPEREYSTIILEHILEHVDDPVAIMKRASEWLEDDGVMILGVPNAHSIHRLAAVPMGLLSRPDELNARDLAQGHQRVYTMASFKADAEAAGLTIIKSGGVFLKPLSNGQIEQDWTESMMDAFFELGKDFPENAADLYLICTKG